MKRKIITYTLLVIVLVIGIVSLTGCGKEKEDDDDDDVSVSERRSNRNNGLTAQEIEDKMKVIESEVALDGRLVVVFKNDNKVDVDYIDIAANFYDENDKLVDTMKGNIYNIGKGQEQVIEFFGDAPEDYDRYEITFKVTDYSAEGYSTQMTDQVAMEDKDNGNEIAITFNNKSKESIEYIEASVVFYKNNKIVGHSRAYLSDLRAGSSEIAKAYYPYDSSYDDVEFDEYKVFYNAYNYR